MPLSASAAVDLARELKKYHDGEREVLDVARRYWKGVQARPMVIPSGTPREVRVMAENSRVNIIPIVINSVVQRAFVDGFRTSSTGDNADVWRAWQANRLDARQTAIHRASSGYGASYAVVLPGDPLPVIRGVSPRNLTALYGEDEDWPMSALERLGNGLWRMYDEDAWYYLTEQPRSHTLPDGGWLLDDVQVHDFDVTPVVRYLDEIDLDADDDVEPQDRADGGLQPMRGQIAPLMALQNQIDMTTFSLQVAQHYGAFRQRWIIGWTADSEEEVLKAAASKVWTFDQSPEGEDGMKLGEFEQTDLKGYLDSREASLRHAATLSQTPVHELIGALVNLSAEALAAAEAGHDRKCGERQTNWGESHEQTLWLAGRAMGVNVPDDAQVVWRDTSARAFAATVDGLGKLAQMLGVPPEELWERIPGVTQQDIERWKATAQQGDSFQALTRMLERQTVPSNGNGAV